MNHLRMGLVAPGPSLSGAPLRLLGPSLALAIGLLAACGNSTAPPPPPPGAPPPVARPSNPSLHLTFASRLRRLSPAGELKR